jgi:hypothetical protein
MTQRYLNDTGVPLSVAAYLSHDSYDFIPNTISATGLMRPLRQTILSRRVPAGTDLPDVVSLLKSRLGTSLHDGIERVWLNTESRNAALLSLGYPQKIVDRIVVNPERELSKSDIPVYMEKRSFREIEGVTVSGKFDFVAEGRVQDFKSTGTFTWVNNTKDADYQLQGSIYRWLNPDIITDDMIAVQFFFTDWQKFRAKQDKKYPAHPVMQKLVPLLTLSDTEDYIRTKLRSIETNKTKSEDELPRCSPKELWQKATTFKYYKSGKVGPRSTKNFDSAADAHTTLMKDGGKGIVVEVPGAVVACNYCPAFSVCRQKDEYLADGTLTPL